MRTKALSFWKSAILVGALATAGCAGSLGLRAVYVDYGPPAPIVEVRPPCPDPSYVWIDGHWGWRSHDYYWVQGYWAEPQPGRVWVAGAWMRADRGWRWRDGYWRQQENAQHDRGRHHGRGHGRGHDGDED